MTTPDMAGPLRSAHTPVVLFPGRKRRREAASRNLVLGSVGTGIPFALAVDSPTLMMLAAEDLCWQLHGVDLEARRPRISRRAARRLWRDERARWVAEGELLATMARAAVDGL